MFHPLQSSSQGNNSLQHAKRALELNDVQSDRSVCSYVLLQFKK